MPEDWAADSHRRTRTLIPPEVTHREKWRLALDMLDSLGDWGMTPPVVADAAYGTNAHLRAGLSERGCTYVLSIRSDVSVRTPRQRPAPVPCCSLSNAVTASATARRQLRSTPPC
ncbi:transposase [Streptomyces sp. NPDC060011]|uniref:transposase n=1 Tax=Streptomyces sp. NPDC060011 TaxID=3347037 RepID=UPI0036A128B7